MSVRRAQQEIDSREFAEWIAYHSLEPFGDEWFRDAQLTAAVASQWATKPRHVAEFMPVPRWRVDDGPSDAENMAAINQFFRMPRGGNRITPG